MSTTAPAPLILDVRPFFTEQRPPLPAILQAVRQLAPGQALQLLAPLEPKPLYDMLAQQGLTASSQQHPDGTWQIDFHPTEVG